MVRITSAHNPVIKYVRSLERASVRREQGAYIAEGVRLVRDALATRQHALLALYDPDMLARSASGSSLLVGLPGWADRWYEVDARVMAAAAQTETSQGVLAVLALPPAAPLSAKMGDTFGVLLDRVSDPGNAGTILRTAAAAGVDYVCAVAGSVDLFAPKVVRAGMGAHFHLPLHGNVSWEIVDRELSDIDLVVSDVHRGHSIYEVHWPERVALVVGSEAHGTSDDAHNRATMRVHVPMRSGVESLNASVAASIVIYSALGPRVSGP